MLLVSKADLLTSLPINLCDVTNNYTNGNTNQLQATREYNLSASVELLVFAKISPCLWYKYLAIQLLTFNTRRFLDIKLKCSDINVEAAEMSKTINFSWLSSES